MWFQASSSCILYAILLFSVSCYTQVQASDIKLHIKGISLYQDSGFISRSASLELDSGLNEIGLVGIRGNLLGAPMIITPAGTKLIAYKWTTDTLQSGHWLDSMKVQDKKIKECYAQRDLVEMQKKLLWDNRKIRVSDRSIYVDDLEELRWYFTQKYTLLNQRIDSLDERIEQYELEKQAFNRIDEQENIIITSKLFISLLSNKMQNNQIEVQYWMDQVDWEISYNIEFKENEQARAYVQPMLLLSQLSGESWDVASIAVNIPAALRNDHLNQLSYSWSFPLQEAIRSSNKKHVVYHTKREVKATLKYVCYPEIGGIVKPMVQLYNNAKWPLAGHDFTVVHNQLFLGTIKATLSADSASTNINCPSFVAVSVNKLVDHNKRGLPLIGKTRNGNQYEVTVESLMPFDFQIELVDTTVLNGKNVENYTVKLPQTGFVKGSSIYITVALQPNEERTLEYSLKRKK